MHAQRRGFRQRRADGIGAPVVFGPAGRRAAAPRGRRGAGSRYCPWPAG
ncbi:hypothetical protein ANDA3_2697 [plant metagenome]|uniref:Uncharacterized protein n=1 Tax=plant metagenome TaxID=1297885 RepID=A0A484TPL6_9ZZZZ